MKNVIVYIDGIHGCDGITNVLVTTSKGRELYRNRWACVEHIYQPIYDTLWLVGERFGKTDACATRDTARDTGKVKATVVWNGRVLTDSDLDDLELDYDDVLFGDES